MNTDPVLASVWRSGIEESVHRGRIAVVDPDGSLEYSLGQIDAAIYPRSASKPIQALAMLEAGLDLDDELLALATASHSGEPSHISGVQEILVGAGLDMDQLRNTPDYPWDETVRVSWIAAGKPVTSLAQNCSGKHAAMLRTCQRAGWPLDSYLDPDHPLQQAITALTQNLTGETPMIGVDGCGAPAHTMSTIGLARVFGRIASARHGNPRRLADAMRGFPTYVSGSRRWEAALHRGVPGLICKIGAEAVLGMGLPNGQGIAIKIMDGQARALPVIAVEVLGLLGIRSEDLTRIGSVAVLGHGQPVGEITSELPTP